MHARASPNFHMKLYPTLFSLNTIMCHLFSEVLVLSIYEYLSLLYMGAGETWSCLFL